jgi:YVTN family beta-propeller protein
MKYDLYRKFFDLLSRRLTFTATWLLVLICGLSAGANPTQAQTQPRAYVTNFCSNTVNVIDLTTNTVIASIPVAPDTEGGVAITPDGTRVYITHTNSNMVSVISTATNTVIATVSTDGCPHGIAITPAPRAPKSKDECKNGGYRNFGPPAGPFRNQGQCVSYVESHSHH